MNKTLSNLIILLIGAVGPLGAKFLWSIPLQDGSNLRPESTFMAYKDHYCLIKQEAINKRQEALYSGGISPSREKIKKVLQAMCQQVSTLVNQQCLASFGLNQEMSNKIEQAFSGLISDKEQQDNTRNITWDLKKIRRATHYFGFMVQWIAKKADRFTFDQCLMLHYALSSFEAMLASQQAEIQTVTNRDMETTLSSMKVLQDQIGHMKDDIETQLLNPTS